MLTNTYLFSGNTFLVDVLKGDWKKKFCEKYGSMSITQVDMEEDGAIEKLQSELESGSFFEEKKLVFVKLSPATKRATAKKTSTKKTKKKDSNPEKIGHLLARKPDSTFVVFLGTAPDSEWSGQIAAENQKRLSAINGKISGYDPVRDISYLDFFTHFFQNKIDQRGLQYTLSAYQRRIRKDTEPDLFFLVCKLEQIAYLDSDFQKSSFLDQLIETEPEEQIFDFLSHILNKRVEKSFSILASVLKNGGHPRQILKTMTGQIEQFFIVSALVAQKQSAGKIAQVLGESRIWLLEKTIQQVRSLTPEALQSFLLILIETQCGLNTGRINGEDSREFQTIFEKTILQFAVKIGSVKNYSK